MPPKNRKVSSKNAGVADQNNVSGPPAHVSEPLTSTSSHNKEPSKHTFSVQPKRKSLRIEAIMSERSASIGTPPGPEVGNPRIGAVITERSVEMNITSGAEMQPANPRSTTFSMAVPGSSSLAVVIPSSSTFSSTTTDTIAAPAPGPTSSTTIAPTATAQAVGPTAPYPDPNFSSLPDKILGKIFTELAHQGDKCTSIALGLTSRKNYAAHRVLHPEPIDLYESTISLSGRKFHLWFLLDAWMLPDRQFDFLDGDWSVRGGKYLTGREREWYRAGYGHEDIVGFYRKEREEEKKKKKKMKKKNGGGKHELDDLLAAFGW